MVSCRPPTPTEPIPSTQTIHIPIHMPPTHIPLTLSTNKIPICMEKFQDSLNDAMHEDNPPNKDSYALIKVPKPPPIVNWKPFKNVGVQQKNLYAKQ